MGQNSTEVAYGFGQFGSAFADTAANTVTPPEELAIIAITFIAETTLDSLVAKEPTKFPNTAESANSKGAYTRTVDGAVTSAAKVIFDQENFVSQADQIEVGDEIYLTSTGVLLGTVLTLDPDGDNTKEIQLAANTSISDGVTVSFLKKKKYGHDGVGGQTIDSTQKFPAGLTIYGRWDSVSLAADDTDGGIICYFGQ